MHSAEQTARDEDIGMADMFGGVSEAPVAAATPVPGLSESERLAQEKQTLGLYLTGHPIEAYLPELDHFCTSLNEVEPKKSLQLVAGLVVSMRTMRSRRGAPMGVLVVDDRSGRIEATMFPEVFEREKHKLDKDDLVVIEGEVQPDDFTGDLKLQVERILTIEEARHRFSRGVTIEFCNASVPDDLAVRLKALLAPHRREESGCAVAVVYQASDAEGRIQLGANWQVTASDELLHSLKSEFGDERVSLAYVST
jgi:DNA polymerase-3 subunit alpha